MATQPEIAPPDTITPQSPPEVPPDSLPAEEPAYQPPGIEPIPPDRDTPDPSLPEAPAPD